MQSTVLVNLPSFVKVVEFESFSQAARSLNMTKSAVSKQVQMLEDTLKVKLLNRTTRSVKLTEQGELFYLQARHIMESLDEAERGVQSLNSRPSGTLKITAPESFGMFHLAPALAQFAQEYPEVQMEIDFSNRFNNIIEEGFDVAIRIASLTDSSLIARKLAPCQMVVAASPEYLERYGTPTHPDQFINHRFIEYSNSDRPKEFRYTDPAGKQGVAPIDVVLRANNSQMMRQAALSHMGIIAGPSFIMGNDIKKGKLTRILSEFAMFPERNIYAVFPQNRYMSAKVRLFIDFIAERFSGTPYWEV
jgi:DNA-binding transcriptional LysR family regulator